MCDFYRMVKSKQDELDLNTCNYTRRSSLDYNAIDKLVLPKETLSKKCSSENAVSSPNTLQRLTFPRFAIHKDFGTFFPNGYPTVHGSGRLFHSVRIRGPLKMNEVMFWLKVVSEVFIIFTTMVKNV